MCCKVLSLTHFTGWETFSTSCLCIHIYIQSLHTHTHAHLVAEGRANKNIDFYMAIISCFNFVDACEHTQTPGIYSSWVNWSLKSCCICCIRISASMLYFLYSSSSVACNMWKIHFKRWCLFSLQNSCNQNQNATFTFTL